MNINKLYTDRHLYNKKNIQWLMLSTVYNIQTNSDKCRFTATPNVGDTHNVINVDVVENQTTTTYNKAFFSKLFFFVLFLVEVLVNYMY